MTSLVIPLSNSPSENTSSMVWEHDLLHTDRMVDYILSNNTSTLNASQDNEKSDEFTRCSNKNMKRSLHFHDNTSILWIENSNDMSDEEIDACYYNSRDYSCFRDRERRLSRNFSNCRFMKGGLKGDLLGIESPLQRLHRRERSRNAVFAVILEQEIRQEHTYSLSEEDALGIARVYQQYTKESERLARERALLNASQVDKIASFSSCSTGEPMYKIEMDKWGEEKHTIGRHHDQPWEVPAYNGNGTIINHPTAMVKYTTCSYPQDQYHYLNMLHSEAQDTSQKQLQKFHDYRYEDQFELRVRELKHENRCEEELVPRKLNRA